MATPLLEYQNHFVTDKNILVTGSTSGIGEALVYQLAELKPRKIFLAARSQGKAEAVKANLDIKGVASQILLGDMGTKAGCKAIADAMIATKEPLHVLVSNAGIWEALKDERVVSPDGFEVHFMTNYLSMVILCKALKQLLEDSGPSRIVITGSFTHLEPMRAGIANIDDIQFEKEPVKKDVANDLTYTNSKLLQYMWAKKFATTVKKDLAVMVYDPGQCETNNDVYKLMKQMVK